MEKYFSISLLFIRFAFLSCSAQNENQPSIKSETSPSGLRIEYIFVPEAEVCEPKSKSGDMLTMHYTGKLQSNGQKFDSR